MNIKRNYIFNTANQLITMLTAVITVPYISRTLGVGNVGIYSYTYSIASYFVMFIVMGLDNYGNREIAKVRDDGDKLNYTFSSIYSMQLLFGVVMVSLYLIYILLFAKNKIMFLIQLIYVISGVIDINWTMHGLEEFKFTSIRNVILNLLNLLCVLLFVKNKDSLYIYTFLLCIGSFANQVIAWSYIKKRINFITVSVSDVVKHIKPNLVLFIPIVAVSVYKMMDKIMLGNLVDMDQVGYYESSEKIIKIPTVLISSLGTVMLPRMANIYASGNFTKGTEYIKRSIDLAMVISTSLCFGIMSVSKEFVPLYYGKGYEACVPLYLILLPCGLFLAFSNVIRTQFLIPKGEDKIFIKAVILGAMVNLIMNLLLIPHLAARGAAIGTLFAEASVCISQAIDTRKKIPIRVLFLRSIPFIILGLAMHLIVYNINFDTSPFIQMMVKVLLGVFIYIVGLTFILFVLKDVYQVNIIDYYYPKR